MMSQAPYALSIVSLEVNDWPSMIVFYRDVLGFQAIELDPEHEYGWLNAGPITLAFRGGKQAPAAPGTRVSLQFEVNRVEDAVQTLERTGCRFYDTKINPGDSYKVAYFYDPEGNALAVFEHH
jgi:predicted enzyme related to lactoylglutathione lyase